jgi:glucose-1-phosphate thymidylyltransferase
MEAVILAGGFATRLYPLTLNTAKPLLDVAGKPAIVHILERLFPLASRGLSGIVIVVPEKFAKDFRSTLSGTWPVPVHIVSNGATTVDQKLGAVGDMAWGVRSLSGNGPFWVLAGDNLFDFDLDPAAAGFETAGERPLVVTHRLASAADTRLYNNIRLSPEGYISEFVEKPRDPWSSLFATCMYLFPRRIVGRLEQFLAEGNDPDRAGDFVRWLSTREEVVTFEPAGTWFDIGSVQELEEAGRFFAGGGGRG